MENYVGLKRSRTYQITETEEVIGVDEHGFIHVRCSYYDSRTGRTDHEIKRVTTDGFRVYVVGSYNFDAFSSFEPGEKVYLTNRMEWDKDWPEILRNLGGFYGV